MEGRQYLEATRIICGHKSNCVMSQKQKRDARQCSLIISIITKNYIHYFFIFFFKKKGWL
jgi:hypothetical protein